MRRDEATLLDMALAADDIRGFIAGMTEAEFRSNRLVQAATERCLGIVGEAVKRLSPAFRATHPDLPWKSMTGLRDILVHTYDKVDLAEIWRIATVEVPKLRAWLEPRLLRR